MTICRFAPSPTGALHLGNIRTAVFNALVARKTAGAFILRLDDTDEERSEERFATDIRRDLEWLGLGWDETYRQSDRIALYDAAAARLKADGRLYPCWETPAELALKRKRLLAAKRPPVYDRAALGLSEEERAALALTRPPHWRFKLDLAPIVWEDGVRGRQEIDASSVSDPVLIREDGRYLYTLCSVVDDAEMGVTDVVRGADHVTNTAAQIQIFEALHSTPPRMAHHSLLVGEGGEKLSKRLGGLSIGELREDGIEPQAILAYLSRLGSSRPVEPIQTAEEVAEGFDLATFGLAPTRVSVEELRLLSVKILHDAPFGAVRSRLPSEVEAPFWEAVRPNLDRLSDIEDWIAVAGGAAAKIEPEDAEFVEAAMALLPPGPWDGGTWGAWTREVKAATGRKGRALFLPLRRALTGRDHGPDMGAFMPFLADRAR
ncbi:MAG: glutamate--tRNA ligase [Pseudomonadota bacterium]